ncbi:MAG: VWA domain-containing protein [Flavobacteriales bacterium]|nr:VWA domain-containing protein [Flavobacteriales bacterium]
MKKAFIMFSLAMSHWVALAGGAGNADIQIAIVLDISSSMNGLIEQAKSQLWSVVNLLNGTKINNRSPELEIALITYGRTDYEENNGFVKINSSLTNDLDLISEELFKLRTNGGSEYCGKAVSTALNSLKWKDEKSVLKAIIIAGNEPFNQGTADYKEACIEARKMGINVNTIFCGLYEKGIEEHWMDGALKGNGIYTAIDQDLKIELSATIWDKKILRYNEDLNATFVPYGADGIAGLNKLMIQDLNAKDLGIATYRDRIATKASGFNPKWDLVTVYDKDTSILDCLSESQLPDQMINMSLDKIKEYLREQSELRALYASAIEIYYDKAKDIVKYKFKNGEGKKSLGGSIVNVMMLQAQAKGFEIDY